MDKFELRPYDAMALSGFLIIPSLFFTELTKLTEENASASWLSLLTACVIMICLFFIFSLLIKKHDGRNITEIICLVFGKPAGILYGTALSIFFCYFTGVHIRESAEIIKIYGMKLTPVYVLSTLIILTAVILNFLGGRTIVKSAGFFYIIIIIGSVFVSLLGTNRYNPDKLVPVFGYGLYPTVINGLFTTSLFSGIVVLMVFAPSLSSAACFRRSGLLSISLAGIIGIILCLSFTMMFSGSIAVKVSSGFIEIGKASYYNHFFYRFESILLFFQIFSSFMLASIGLFAARESFLVKPAKNARMRTIICALAVFIAAFIPMDIFELTRLYLPLVRRYGIIFIGGVPVLTLIVSTFKGLIKHEKV